MKHSLTFLILALGLSTTAFGSTEFLPGMLKMHGENIALRAVCAEKSGDDECISFHFHKVAADDATITPSIETQITPYPMTLKDLKSLKANEIFFSIFSPDGEPMVSDLEGVNLFWVWLLGPIDLAGYAIGTPLYSGYKVIENIKYRKLLRFVSKGKNIELYSQGFRIVDEEICNFGIAITLEKVIETVRKEVFESGEEITERGIRNRALKRIKGCGFLE